MAQRLTPKLEVTPAVAAPLRVQRGSGGAGGGSKLKNAPRITRPPEGEEEAQAQALARARARRAAA